MMTTSEALAFLREAALTHMGTKAVPTPTPHEIAVIEAGLDLLSRFLLNVEDIAKAARRATASTQDELSR